MVHYCQKDQQLEVKSYRIYDKEEPKAAEENMPDRGRREHRGVFAGPQRCDTTGPVTALEQGGPHHCLLAASLLYTGASVSLEKVYQQATMSKGIQVE